MFNIKDKLNRFLDDMDETENKEEPKIIENPQDFKAKQTELSNYLNTLKDESKQDSLMPVNAQNKISVNEIARPNYKLEQIKVQDIKVQPKIQEAAPIVLNRSNHEVETSFFTNDVIINGDINTGDPLQLNGYMKGNIDSTSRMALQGTLDGNIKSVSAQIHASVINGSINCEQNVVVTGRSQVSGDIYNDNLAFDGVIQGNIYSKGKVQIDANAEIYGNVTASTISIDEGAIVQGNVKINTKKSFN